MFETVPEVDWILAKLQLNDASFSFEPESSSALGLGLVCGF